MTEVKTETPQAPVAAKPNIPVKLTAEEAKDRYEFIGRCVDRNINFPSSNKFGVIGAMTMQDLCTSNIATLQKIAVSIKKANEDHDPEFNGEEPLKINTITAEKWLTFLRLTIRKKNYDTWLGARKAEVKELNATIAQAKTPEELRREAEGKLHSLQSILGTDIED